MATSWKLFWNDCCISHRLRLSQKVEQPRRKLSDGIVNSATCTDVRRSCKRSRLRVIRRPRSAGFAMSCSATVRSQIGAQGACLPVQIGDILGSTTHPRKVSDRRFGLCASGKCHQTLAPADLLPRAAGWRNQPARPVDD